MICILNRGKFNHTEGFYSDPECYNVDEKELEKFDKKFPFKIKERREK